MTPPAKTGVSTDCRIPPTAGMKNSSVDTTANTTTIPIHAPGAATKMRQLSPHHAAPSPASTRCGSGAADGPDPDGVGIISMRESSPAHMLMADAQGPGGHCRVADRKRRGALRCGIHGPISRVPASSKPQSMNQIAGQLIAYGVPLVGLNVLLQQLGLPIPAVPTMMIAGALAVAGRLDFAQAFAIAVAASLTADLIWFWAGRRYGY